MINDCRGLVSLGEKEQVLPHNLESMTLECCESLEKMPNSCESLRYLSILYCKKLNYFPSTKQLVSRTENKEAIAMTGSRSSNNEEMEGFHNLETLYISYCPCLTSLPTGKKLPSTLKNLCIYNCENLEEPEEVDSKEKTWLLNSKFSLEYISIGKWANLKPLREGCFLGFIHLTSLWIYRCEGIVSILERCLPPSLRVVHIYDCKNLKSLLLYNDVMKSLQELEIKNLKSLLLYDNDMESLQKLGITGCENLESYPHGGWPANLKELRIGDVKQPITEWGHSLPTSLTHLTLDGKFPALGSLSDVGSPIPTSLRYLKLRGSRNLKSLSDGLQNLTSLEELYIKECPKLQSLPDMLPPTLSYLDIRESPLMKERCSKDRGDYWAA